MSRKVHFQKALWIAHEIGEDPDDIYDVLLGNITTPKEFVNAVENCSKDYDNQKERGLREE